MEFVKKANWETFTTLCQEQLTPEKFKTAEDMSAFTSALHDISEKCIPKSSTRSKRRNPWYNDECKTAINKRKSALRKFNKNPSRKNHMHSKVARAKARRTIDKRTIVVLYRYPETLLPIIWALRPS